MTPTALLIAVLLAASPSARCPKTSKPDFKIQLPQIGPVDVWTYEVQGKEDSTGVAVLCDSQGKLLRKVRMDQYGNGSIQARLYDVPEGWPSPVLAIVSDWSRADGISVDTVALVVNDGHLEQRLDLSLDLAETACLGSTPSTPDVAMTVVEFLDGNYCFLCWPKYFRATTYVWKETRLVRRATFRTKKKHPDWQSALRELKLPCPAEIVHETMDHGQ